MKTKLIIPALLLIAATTSAQDKKDWPGIGRYEKANANTPPPTKGKVRVVYMGDSITDAWINNDSTFFKANNYIDRGISGQTTGQMLIRFRPDVIIHKPDVVVILAGINDIAENNGPSKLEDVMGNIKSMAELARANKIKVVLSSILPAAAFPWKPTIDPKEKVKALNEMIQTYAAENKFIYLDYFTPMTDENRGLPKKWSGDGIHPNLDGYKVMEPLAQSAIAAALKAKQW
ncbi:MAG: SGNH/GDSL hydrolase family protein [Bacteroidota bacterium]